MRIVLIGNYLYDRQESMQRFAALMMRGLSAAGHSVRLLQPPLFAGRLSPSANGFGKWLGYIDKMVVFPLAIRHAVRNADVIHILDHSNAIYAGCLRNHPHLVTCHDVLAIRSAQGAIRENPTRWPGRQLQRIIANGLRRCRYIACVSTATRRDLSLIQGVDSVRTSVVYNSLNYDYSQMPAELADAHLRRLGIDPATRFVLHVGGNNWYKNRRGVLEIFARLRADKAGRHLSLVMVGKPLTAEMRRTISAGVLSDAVLELVGVSEEDLRALYSRAEMLLFPSLAEGFGWPIIEAQACGCPVATSNRPPMTEVGGDAAVYVDPEDYEAAAKTLVTNLPRLGELRAGSIANAARFSTASMIDAYLDIYAKLAQSSMAYNSLS
jgi:glycosyltransferase involved in cell wall biosynthesis